MDENTKDESEEQFLKAKAYLQQVKDEGDSSLYDHFTSVLTKLLDERPQNSIDLIENYFEESKKHVLKSEPVKDDASPDTPTEEVLAQQQIKLFDPEADMESAEPPQNENEEEFDIPLPNVMELAHCFEQAGIGLAREELYRVFLALKQLVFSYPLTSVRFWGKIFGVEKNYIVAEVEFREGEDAEEEVGEGEGDEEREDDRRDDGSEEGVPSEEDDIPKSQWKPPPVIPKEDHHNGTNKKVYFVCNEAGQPWVRLPHVNPAQIVAARQIKKFFTGKLDTQIISFPPFNGTEANYLRAQIARISAGTHISPAGYFIFEEDEEEEEEGQPRDSFEQNVEFEGLPLRDLVDPSMQNWIHHVQHILPQGRCTWYDPFQKPEDDFEDEDLDEEEEDKMDSVQPEVGPPLLTCVADDEALPTVPAWTTYASSKALPEYAVAVVRSNRWPGAYTFSKGRKFENIYIGYGHKYKAENYSPPIPPTALDEYPVGPDVMEMDDPTVEDEQALKRAQEEAMKAAEEMDGIDDDEDDAD
ncbi:radial spoke head protein 4 homolog A-like isoform X2 [Rhopilema esculentum]|uniref:radial spoke head protein 4 homolog A-like isoform X2 n=1 Tax=Rhopilema esculentum TaxID=499914 RepID=UPI0031CE8A45|eukprot:gene1410-15826_t